MIILDIPQLSEEWFVAKAGLPSCSNFDKIIQVNGKPSKQRQKYMYQLAGERITKIREETYQNSAMLRGIELEEEARKLYEMLKDVKVEQAGICYPDEEKKYACSPDGLVGEDGLVEIKCPILSTHVGYLIDNCVPATYFQQLQGQLLVTGRLWVDFISHYAGIRPLIIRVERDIEFITALEKELKLFCKELDEVVEKIK